MKPVTCEIHPEATLEQVSVGWFCPCCQRVVHPGNSRVPVSMVFATPDLNALPYPVAYPWQFARYETPGLTPSDRLNNLIFAAYQGMRLTGLLLLGEYFFCDATCRSLDSSIRSLRMPHWGEWTNLCDKLCSFWLGHIPGSPPPFSPRFPNLIRGWREVSTGKGLRSEKWQELLRGLPGLQGHARSANDALQKFRNDRAHRLFTITSDRARDEEALNRYLPIVERILSALFGEKDFSLIHVSPANSGKQVSELAGPNFQADGNTSREFSEAGEIMEGIFVCAQNEIRNGVPLIIGADHCALRCNRESKDPCFMLDSANDKRLIFLGAKGSAESSDLVAPFFAQLEKKSLKFGLGRDETKRCFIADVSRMKAQQTVERLFGMGMQIDEYVFRSGVDDALRHYRDISGKALLIIGDAGIGKSSLIAGFVKELIDGQPQDADEMTSRKTKKAGEINIESFLKTKGSGDIVLFLSGRTELSGDTQASGTTILCDSVVARADIRPGTFASLSDFAALLAPTMTAEDDPTSKAWIIIDGINEADRFLDIMKALDGFLPLMGTYPWLRLIVTMRSGALNSIQLRHQKLLLNGSQPFENDRFLCSFPNEQDEFQPYLVVRPLSRNEVRDAYLRRQKNRPDCSCLTPWENLPDSIHGLLSNPYVLNLFHETYPGKADLFPGCTEKTLLGAWLDRVGETSLGIKATLERVGQALFEHRRPYLPIEVAEEWIGKWRNDCGFTSLLHAARLDPLEELVSLSIFSPPTVSGESLGFHFRHQLIAEEILFRELQRQIRPAGRPDIQMWETWRDHAGSRGDFSELITAMGRVFVAMLQQVEARFLPPFIQHANPSIHAYFLRLSLFHSCIGKAACRPIDLVSNLLGHYNHNSDDQVVLLHVISDVIHELRMLGDEGTSIPVEQVLLDYFENNTSSISDALRVEWSKLLCRSGYERIRCGRISEGMDLMQKSLSLLEQENCKAGENHHFELAHTLSLISRVVGERGNLEESKTLHGRAVDICQQHIDGSLAGKKWQELLLTIINNHILTVKRANPYDPQIMELFDKAMTLIEEVSDENGRCPLTILLVLCNIRLMLAEYVTCVGRNAYVTRVGKNAVVGIRRTLLQGTIELIRFAFNENRGRDFRLLREILFNCVNNLAISLAEDDPTDERRAESLFQEAIRLAESISKMQGYSASSESEHANALLNLGELYAGNMKYSALEKQLDQVQGILRRASKESLSTVRYIFIQAQFNALSGTLFLSKHDLEKSRKHLLEAERLYKYLQQKVPDNEVYGNKLKNIQGFIRTLDLTTKNEPVRSDHSPGRNEKCSCGSGKKFKKCCGKDEVEH